MITPTEEFKQIAHEVLQRCEDVRCTLPEFITGVDVVMETLRTSRDCAVDAHRATGQLT